VTDGVYKDTEVPARLELAETGADVECVGLGLGQIINVKVEVSLLGNGAFGPGGCLVVGDFLQTEYRNPITLHFNPRDVLRENITQRLNLVAEEIGVEGG
jgi:hypothetical protein